MDNNDYIDDNLLAAYAEGRTNAEETMRVVRALAHDSRLREALDIIRSVDWETAAEDIPLERAAAAAGDNLCDVMCERRILRNYLTKEEYDRLDGIDSAWLAEHGVPMHDMGGLLAAHGMTVTRRYGCTEKDIREALASGAWAIAAVDAGSLSTGFLSDVFHAVVVLSIDNGLVRLYDPTYDEDVNYLLDGFLFAWKATRYYLVTAYPGGEHSHYVPKPLDVSDVDLDADLIDLTELLAENAHEAWAARRAEEGWSYGKRLDGRRKRDPRMVPFTSLPDTEKEVSRTAAMDTLRLVEKLGFRISRSALRPCPTCRHGVEEKFAYCPYCGTKLSDK